MGLKKYLEKYSTIKDYPLMGVKMWGIYYMYAIVLKCSNKFFEQAKELGWADVSIDIELFEYFEFLVSNAKESIVFGVKNVSFDLHGVSHIDVQ